MSVYAISSTLKEMINTNLRYGLKSSSLIRSHTLLEKKSDWAFQGVYLSSVSAQCYSTSMNEVEVSFKLVVAPG